MAKRKRTNNELQNTKLIMYLRFYPIFPKWFQWILSAWLFVVKCLFQEALILTLMGTATSHCQKEEQGDQRVQTVHQKVTYARETRILVFNNSTLTAAETQSRESSLK